MPGSKRARLKRMLTPWRHTREEGAQIGVQAPEEPALSSLAMIIGNDAMNAAPYMGELQSRIPAPAPAFDEEEMPEDTASDSVSDRAAETETEAEANTDTAMSRDPMSDLYHKLRTSKRGGLHRHSGNSEQYEGVMRILGSINAAMGQGFSADSRSNIRQVQNMEAMYRQLITICDAYIDQASVRFSHRGRQRSRLVRQIRELAVQDMVGLAEARMELRSMPEEQQAGKSWREIVEKARMVHLRVRDFSRLNKATGGQASEVLKIKDNGGAAEGTSVRVQGADGSEEALSQLHFFKPEDEFDLEQATIAGKIVNKILERFPQLSEEDKAAIRQVAMASEEGELQEPAGLSEQGKLAFAVLQANERGAGTTFRSLMDPSGIAAEGGKINMTKRNVATSRMAALLGLEHLVAKSQEVEIFDEATNQSIRGNLMEKAEGISLQEDLFQGVAAAKGSGHAIKVSSGAQRDLLNLQILDVLCGQMDRHMGNIMVTLDRQTPINEEAPITGEETVTGIQAIDNDAAFGTNTDVVGMELPDRSDRRVYDPETGEITLPYMDKNLAERILELSPEVVRFALQGLITEAEIEAALKRLEMMQSAIRKSFEKSPDKFLEDDQWNDNTAQELFDRSWNAEGNLDDERDAEQNRLLKETIPDIMAIPPGKRTKEQQETFRRVDGEIRTMLRTKYRARHMNESNYFGRVLIKGMNLFNLRGEAPRLRPEEEG